MNAPPIYPTQSAYVEPKSGRVQAPGCRLQRPTEVDEVGAEAAHGSQLCGGGVARRPRVRRHLRGLVLVVRQPGSRTARAPVSPHLEYTILLPLN